jgi:Stability determinant
MSTDLESCGSLSSSSWTLDSLALVTVPTAVTVTVLPTLGVLRPSFCKAAAYSEWLAVEIHQATADPRPNLSHDEVMAEMDADIAALAATHKPTRRKRA